jgi:hypothetical protein
MKILIGLTVIALLFVVGVIKVEFRWWTSDGDSNIPAAKDAKRLLTSVSAVRLDASSASLMATVNGIKIKTPEGQAVLQYQVQGIAARLAEQCESARLRLVRTHVDTYTGRQLRDVYTRMVLAERIMYDDLARGVATKRTARQAAVRWIHRYNRLQQWFAARMQSVIAQAPLEDQAPVVAALDSFNY